ncbi:MAG: DUF1016 N-terminal domain-containing protein, partial [Cytophagaceae bacterium]
MIKFYLSYHGNTKLAPMVKEIGWSHNIVIMEKCKDDLEREFYMRMTKKYGWTKNVLIHQVEGKSYEKFLLNQTNFDSAGQFPQFFHNKHFVTMKSLTKSVYNKLTT